VPNNTPGGGGSGTSSNITGTAITRAAGGGGVFESNGANGAANTGNGAGGSFDAARNGGSGIVILRYPDSFTITIGAGLTGTTTTASPNKITTITVGSGNVSWA
jgi:hypothetical protein